jgi:DNA-directed RNA polymerase subunit RPC12/RpoP
MPILNNLSNGEDEDEFECLNCGSLILVNIVELEESEDVECSHCGTPFRYDRDNFLIYAV